MPRLSTRCRGAPRRRGELRKVLDLACGIVQATKNHSPPPLTVARFGVLLPSAPSLSVFALLKPASSARPSFLLSQVSSSLAQGLSLRLSPHAFTTYTNGWIGQGTGVSPPISAYQRAVKQKRRVRRSPQVEDRGRRSTRKQVRQT